jgi:hypothetical protein
LVLRIRIGGFSRGREESKQSTIKNQQSAIPSPRVSRAVVK